LVVVEGQESEGVMARLQPCRCVAQLAHDARHHPDPSPCWRLLRQLLLLSLHLVQQHLRTGGAQLEIRAQSIQGMRVKPYRRRRAEDATVPASHRDAGLARGPRPLTMAVRTMSVLP